MADATTPTEAGYVGEDVETSSNTATKYDFVVQKAQRGYCLLMKLTRSLLKSENPSILVTCLVKVQQALLKLVEGTRFIPPQEKT